MKKTKPKDYGLAEVFGITEVMQKLDKLTESFEEIKERLKPAKIIWGVEDIAELRKQLEEEDWPEYGDDYYYWDVEDGTIASREWYNNIEDRERMARGELFKTKEACEEDDKKRRALARIEKFIYANGLQFQPDWSDGNQPKYFISYDYVVQSFLVNTSFAYSKNPNSLIGYFRTHEDKLKVIDNCLADLKILFGIK